MAFDKREKEGRENKEKKIESSSGKKGEQKRRKKKRPLLQQNLRLPLIKQRKTPKMETAQVMDHL